LPLRDDYLGNPVTVGGEAELAAINDFIAGFLGYENRAAMVLAAAKAHPGSLLLNAYAGILWMLFVTQTTFSVPSLMGAIMTIGVATANSILMVVFANDERLAGKDRVQAALNAGHTRLRPVIMTAFAMIIGMFPMALALGEGGEQNAPLGRAVIGGLIFATFGTLFIVPVIYSLLKKQPPIDYSQEIDHEEHEGEDQKQAHAQEQPA